MLITTQNEIISLMPTARWDRPSQLYGYLEEEERITLEPLLGTSLYQQLLSLYVELRETYTDITATTIRPTGMARENPKLSYADVTERLERIQNGSYKSETDNDSFEEYEISKDELQVVRLIRICQQIEFYKMLSHKAGLLTVSFNEGGGMNTVSAAGYDEADEKAKDRVVKDAYMSAGRAIDSLLLFLEADAKGDKLFTDKWREADAFYLHKDLLFQTARVLNEYIDIKSERMAYIALVRDIRFCQNTYLKPRIGAKLLKAVIAYANEGGKQATSEQPEDIERTIRYNDAVAELLTLLRSALAFYVESRRTDLPTTKDKLARRDSMTDAQQALAMACEFVESNLNALGEAATHTPIYNNVYAKKAQEEADRKDAQAAVERQRQAMCKQQHRQIFTGFPATHRTPERR